MQSGVLTPVIVLIVVIVALLPLIIDLLDNQNYLGLILPILGITIGLAIPFLIVWIYQHFDNRK